MQPDWYPAWRDEAFDQLAAKNARLEQDFRLGHWMRYNYDLAAGKLIFSDKAGAKVISEIQIAGSTSAKAGNWLWAWANSNLPCDLLGDAKLVRAFGEKKGVDDLAQAYVDDTSGDLDALGWELTAAMVRVCNALGAYRSSRGEGGALYLVFKNIRWAN